MSQMNNAGNGHEQPCERRFPIQQEVHYRCFKGRQSLNKGMGKTVVINSREVEFTTEHDLQTGQEVEVAMHWPVLLRRECLMKLVIYGPVVSSEAGRAVVRIRRYEFRTRAAQPMLAMSHGAG